MEMLLFTTEIEGIEVLREGYNEGLDSNDDSYLSDDAIIELEWDRICKDYNSIFELNDFYDCVLIGSVGLWNGNHKSATYIPEPKNLKEKCSNYDTIRIKRERNNDNIRIKSCTDWKENISLKADLIFYGYVCKKYKFKIKKKHSYIELI